MNWTYLIIGGSGAIVALLAYLFQLRVRHKDVIVRGKDATIETLEKNIDWLKQQLEVTKAGRPDILAETYSQRVALLEGELQRLLTDRETNQALIQKKEDELAETKTSISELQEQITKANDLLGELEYFKEEFGCPTCGAKLTTLAGEDVEFREYSCGSMSGPNGEYPCPHDPEFPKLEDYNLEVRQVASDKFFCNPQAKNRNAYKLTLQPQSGNTEEGAKQKIKTNYERLLPKNLREPKSV